MDRSRQPETRKLGGTLGLAGSAPSAPGAGHELGGRQGVIVVTDAVVRRRGERGAQAVLEHERAHHQLISVADTMAVVLGFIPLFQEAPSVLSELVELAAPSR